MRHKRHGPAARAEVLEVEHVHRQECDDDRPDARQLGALWCGNSLGRERQHIDPFSTPCVMNSSSPAIARPYRKNFLTEG